jgi:BirA family transcriptional regulator, biotin operon repressor / biotin---[acetyl-CoA-carboxylase] ligase
MIRINQLSKEQIECYNVNCPGGLIQPEHLKKNLPGIRIQDFIQIHSTNTYLKQHPNLPIPCLCYSEYQTQGKGRLGRQWQSPFGLNLNFSLSWRFYFSIQHLQGLSLCVGLAVANAIETYCNIAQLKIKWPNDLLFEHHKLAGILIEIVKSNHEETDVILGIGINVNALPQDIHLPDRKWTSLSQILGSPIIRQDLLITIISTLEKYLIQFEAKSFASFMQEWQLKDALFGENITIKKQHRCLTGIARGVNAQGYLILQEGAHTRLVDVGDATLSI